MRFRFDGCENARHECFGRLQRGQLAQFPMNSFGKVSFSFVIHSNVVS